MGTRLRTGLVLFSIFTCVIPKEGLTQTQAIELPPNWNTVRHYAEAKQKGLAIIYLAAAGGAFLSANTDLASMKQPLLYCQPEKLTLDPKNYVTIFEEKLATMSPPLAAVYEDAPLEFVLLMGLRETFPCPTTK